MVRGISQHFAQPHYRVVQAMIKIHESVAGPQAFAQVIPGDDFSRGCQQYRQNLEGLLRQFQPETVLAQFSRLNIDFEHAEAHVPRRAIDLSHTGPGMAGSIAPQSREGQRITFHISG